MSRFPFQIGDSIEVHTKALFSQCAASRSWSSNESSRDKGRRSPGWGVRLGTTMELRVSSARRHEECRWFCNEGLSAGLWVFIKMFLILIRLNLISGYWFLLTHRVGPSLEERREKERHRDMCYLNLLWFITTMWVHMDLSWNTRNKDFALSFKTPIAYII